MSLNSLQCDNGIISRTISLRCGTVCRKKTRMCFSSIWDNWIGIFSCSTISVAFDSICCVIHWKQFPRPWCDGIGRSKDSNYINIYWKCWKITNTTTTNSLKWEICSRHSVFSRLIPTPIFRCFSHMDRVYPVTDEEKLSSSMLPDMFTKELLHLFNGLNTIRFNMQKICVQSYNTSICRKNMHISHLNLMQSLDELKFRKSLSNAHYNVITSSSPRGDSARAHSGILSVRQLFWNSDLQKKTPYF